MAVFEFGSNRASAGARDERFDISASTLFGPQAQAFSQLFPAATDLALNNSQAANQIGAGLSADLSGAGFNFLNQIQQGQSNQGIGQLFNFQPQTIQQQGINPLQFLASGGGGFGGPSSGGMGQPGFRQEPLDPRAPRSVFGAGSQRGGELDQQFQQFGGAGGAPFRGSALFNQFAGSDSPLLASGFSQLQNLAGGGNALQQQLAGTQPNMFLEDAIGNIGTDIAQQLERQNLAGAQSSSLAGQRGGARQGVAEGIASQAAIEAFSQQAGGIRAQDAAQQRQLQQQGQLAALQSQQGAAGQLLGSQTQAAGQLAQAGLGNQQIQAQQQALQLQALQSAGGLQQQQNQLGIQGAGVGLGSLGNIFNVGLGGTTAGFGPLSQLGGLVSPINQQFAFGQGIGTNQSSDRGMNFGVGFL